MEKADDGKEFINIALLDQVSDADLKKIRNTYFNEYGLYKVRPYPFSTFLEYGAKVFTSGYFCEKGYTGNITVKTDINEYYSAKS